MNAWPTNTALSWLHVFKAYDNCCDGRTYAQVLSKKSKSQSTFQPLHDNKSTRIVVNRPKNANSNLVTPFKVGIKIRSNIFPDIKDHVQVCSKLHKYNLQKMKISFHFEIVLRVCNNFLVIGHTLTHLMPGKTKLTLQKQKLHLQMGGLGFRYPKKLPL